MFTVNIGDNAVSEFSRNKSLLMFIKLWSCVLYSC